MDPKRVSFGSEAGIFTKLRLILIWVRIQGYCLVLKLYFYYSRIYSVSNFLSVVPTFFGCWQFLYSHREFVDFSLKYATRAEVGGRSLILSAFS